MSESVYTLEPAPPSSAPVPEVTEGVRVGSALAHDTAHTSEGLGRLLEQFKEKQRIEDFLSAFLNQVQDAEDAAWTLYVSRTLAAATGDLLDKLGGLVGEERRGRTDDQFRRFIGVRILTNRSNGEVEELYSIVRQIFGGTFSGWIDEYDPAAEVLSLLTPVTTDAPANEIDIVLRRAKAAGVNLQVIYSADLAANQLIIASSLSTVAGAGTLGSSVSGSGSKLFSVHEV